MSRNDSHNQPKKVGAYMFHKIAFAFILIPLSLMASAQGTLFKVPTREGVKTTLFWHAAPDAMATVLLLPGGGGGFGQVKDGKPTSNNFLGRSESFFVANGFNVAIFGRPSDSQEVNYADRVSDAHMTDIHKVLEFVKQKGDVPVWIVGTSRGTVSAAAAAIKLQGEMAGVILTSSVVSSKKPEAVPRQDLAAIRFPVLVFHHTKDACDLCQPSKVPSIFRGLKNAPIKKEIMFSGGENPTGDVCHGQHWHGFVGA